MGSQSNNLKNNQRVTKILKIFKILALTVITLLVIYNLYLYLYLDAAQQQQLDKTYNLKNKTVNIATESELQNIQNQLASLKSEVIKNQEDLNLLNNTVSNMPLIQSNVHHTLINIKNLVNIAIVKLSIEKDVDSANSVLTIAQQSLLNTSNHDLQALRKNILIKLEQLKEVKQPDTIQLKAALQEYANLIDKLSVLDFVSGIKNEKAVSRQNRQSSDLNSDLNSDLDKQTLWQRFVINFQNNFYELVKIRNIKGSDVSFAKLQSEEHINLIKTYFKLKTTELSVDLQQRNNKFFSEDVNNLMHNTNLYFANNLELKQKLVNLLNSMKDININPDLPELYGLGEEIDNLIKLFKDKQDNNMGAQKLNKNN